MARVGTTIVMTVLAVVASMAMAHWATPAEAAVGIDAFDGAVLDQGGDEFSQAGGHPFTAATTIEFATPPDIDESVRRIVTDLPAGFVGNPEAVPVKCEAAELAQLSILDTLCPPASQVGTVFNRWGGGGGFVTNGLYAMDPPDDRTAVFGFSAYGAVTVHLFATVRRVDGEYRTRVVVRDVPQVLVLGTTTATLWGVPADPAHNSRRKGANCFPGCSLPASIPETAFLTNPTSCTEPGRGVFTDLAIEGWQGSSDTASFESHDNNGDPLGPTGCETVPFDPQVSIQPTETSADTPTGLKVELAMPQQGLLNPVGIAQAHLKRTEVLLPEGMAINPSAADGLGACSPAQIDLEGDQSPSCPQSSRIGTVAIDTPLLGENLEGSVYLAEQNNNPFGSDFAIYLVAEGRGVVIKLPGEITPDEETGQLRAVFDDNPELPFSKLTVRFKGGDRASLVTPPTCGEKQVATTLTSWARPGEEVHRTDSFDITSGPGGEPCSTSLAARPFNPQMNAGLQNPVAGAYSPFTLRLTRQDGEQEILATTVTPPKGVTAKLTGVPLCSDARANAGTCPAASEIGEVIVGAGAGPSPFYIQPPNQGHVYMTGPYKGEQLGMLIQVPAKAGPFDLGLVNVRAAVHVDKHTAQLRVISDPIPQILEGIPLRVKDIRVLINRPDFTIAPTDCDPMTVQARVRGSSGASAHLINRFQVGGCASLGFNPKLKLDFGKRRKDTRRNQHPPLHANLNFNQGDANISYVQVALPKGVFLDQERLGRICSRANYAANTCPAESRVGYAKATTPLLDDPVEGPVYLKSSDNPLPDLAADLNGQIDIDLFGKIDQKENKKGLAQIRNTFDVVPDVPVSHFSLTLSGGKDGLLVNSRNICRKRRSQKISIEIKAHNEAMLKQKPLIGSACKKINKKNAKKLRKKIKKLRRKAKKANSHKRARKARHKGKKLKKQLRKLRR